MVEAAKVSAARKLGKCLLKRKLPDGFTARDVVRKGWTGLATTLQAEAALAILEDHGWTVSNDLQENIGRPTTRHCINPNIYGRAP